MDNASMKTTLSRRRVIALLAGASGGLVAARTRARRGVGRERLGRDGFVQSIFQVQRFCPSFHDSVKRTLNCELE